MEQTPSEVQGVPEFCFSVEQVAKALQVHPVTVHRWIRSGRVRAFRVAGGPWRVPESAYVALMERECA